MKFTEHIIKLNRQRNIALPALFNFVFHFHQLPIPTRAPEHLQDQSLCSGIWVRLSAGPTPPQGRAPAPLLSLAVVFPPLPPPRSASRGRSLPSSAPRPPDRRRLGLLPRLPPAPSFHRAAPPRLLPALQPPFPAPRPPLPSPRTAVGPGGRCPPPRDHTPPLTARSSRHAHPAALGSAAANRRTLLY